MAIRDFVGAPTRATHLALVDTHIALAERLFRSLYRIRRVEEEIARVYPSDKIKSPVHLSIGQEAVAVGVCAALEPHDVVFGTYRGHAAYLAKGGDLPGMLAELYGKSTGVAKGKAGSMHLIDTRHGVLGMSAVVGTTVPHAAGYAYALKKRRSKSIVVCFMGDGASEEGVFYETLNFAALKDLPVLFVCENNGYAIHSPQATRQKNTNIADRVSAFGLPARRLADDDVFTLYETTREAIACIRAGLGPRFVECPTYRWKEHVGPGDDYHVGYRSIDDARPWMEQDQLILTGAQIPTDARHRIQQAVETEIAEAFAYAEASPFPPAEELMQDIYAD